LEKGTEKTGVVRWEKMLAESPEQFMEEGVGWKRLWMKLWKKG
jgi:hypothetical protein